MASGLRSTRFNRAATPSGGSANLSGRIIGANPRKSKMTEAPGTNPSKLGGGGASLMGNKPHNRLNPRYAQGYAQDSAPHKALDIKYPFDAGGPGFPKSFK